jgi:alpha-ketoglutarate-dependent taurine dioxygenase/glutathione synthase/RimK-type ligase-like ATP-grasp enzyme
LAVLQRLDIQQFAKSSSTDLSDFSRTASKILTKPPYCFLLEGLQTPCDDNQLYGVAAYMGQKSAENTNTTSKRPSFTKVRVNPDEATSYKGVTGYSRTHLALSLHTDSTYMPVPHELVAFQCVNSAGMGGVSTYAHVEEVEARLSPEIISLLEETVYPFGRGHHAILSHQPERTIRYYKGQLDFAVGNGAELDRKYQDAITELDNVLAKLALKNQVLLQPGQALIFNNSKALHGRTAFDETSDRLFLRLRHRVDFNCLAKPPLGLKDRFWGLFKNKPVGNDFISGHMASNASQTLTHSPKATIIVPDSYLDLLVSESVEDIKVAAKEATRLGRFHEAELLFKHILSIDAANIDSHFALAAISQYKDDPLQSRHYLQKVSEISVIKGQYSNRGLPKLLRIRGLKDIKYTLLKGKSGYHASLQRGHFSLSNLWNAQAHDVISGSIFDDASIEQYTENQYPDVILNTIACADRMAPALKTLHSIWQDKYPNAAMINAPQGILKSTRLNNYKRLSKIDGVVFPKTVRHQWTGNNLEKLVLTAEEDIFEFPIILRPAATHTGSGMQLVQDTDAFKRYFYSQPTGEDYYLIQYHELADPRGLYNKSRVFFIDGQLFPVAGLTHNQWNIHSGDRYSVMDKNPWTQVREQAFLHDIAEFYGSEIVARLHKVSDIMNLDFFGIDFTVTESGELFIFEANAAMRHNFDHANAFPYTRPYLQRISQAFQNMVTKKTQQNSSGHQ